jgi:protocatechuate 4,5-dioxygenase beta chain
MAKIIGGVATSHVPAIGAAIDLGKTETDYWKPMFDGYIPSKKWMADTRPDVAILVYRDRILPRDHPHFCDRRCRGIPAGR